MISIQDIATSLTTLVSGALGAKVLEYFIKKRKQNEKAKLIYNLENLSKLYQEVASLVDSTKIERVIVFKGHNSGAIPKPGNPFFISALHWDSRVEHDQEVNIGEKYKKVSADGAYIDMLLSMIREGSQKLVVKDMHDCMLKRIYESIGVKYSEIYFLDIQEPELFYVSLATTQDVRFDSPEDKIHIELAIDKIRQVFKGY